MNFIFLKARRKTFGMRDLSFLIIIFSGIVTIPSFAQTASVTIKAIGVYSVHDASNENEDYRFKFTVNTTPRADPCLSAGNTHHQWLNVNYNIVTDRPTDVNENIDIQAEAWEEDGCRGVCDYNDSRFGCDDNFHCSTRSGTIASAPSGVPTGGSTFQIYNLAPGNVSTNIIEMWYCDGNYRVRYQVTYRLPRPITPVVKVDGATYTSGQLCNDRSMSLATNTFINPVFHSSVTLTWYYNLNDEKTLVSKPNPDYCGDSPSCGGGGTPLSSFSVEQEAQSSSLLAVPIDPGDPPACCFEPRFIKVEEFVWRVLGTTSNASDIVFMLRDIPGVSSASTGGNINFRVVASANSSSSVESTNTNDVHFSPRAPEIVNPASSIIITPSCKNTVTGSIVINNISGTTGNYRYVMTKAGDGSFGRTVSFTSNTVSIDNLAAGTYNLQVANNGGLVGSCATNYEISIPTHSDPDVTASVNNHVSCSGGSDGRINVSATGGNPNVNIEFAISPNAGTFVRLSSTAGYFTNLPANTYTVTGVDKVGENNCGAPDQVTGLVINQPTRASGSYSSVVDPDCSNPYNGSVTVSGSSSQSGKYNYRIYRNASLVDDELNTTSTSVMFTGLLDGSYYITVTDADRDGCAGYQSPTFNIAAPVALNLTLTQTQKNVNCYNANNGEIFLTASGGSRTQDYRFTLTNTTTSTVYNNSSSNFVSISKTQVKFQSLPPGNYTAKVENNDGCANIDQETGIIVTQPGLITPVITKKEITCRDDADGRLTLTEISGGSGNFNYTWEFETRDQLNELVWDVYTSNVTTANNLDPGKYRLKVTETSNSSCFIYSQTYTFENPSIVTVASPTFSHVTCKGANDGAIQFTASGGWGGPFTYRFSRNGAPYSDLLPTTKLSPGDYELRAVDRLGCVADYDDQLVITEPGQALSATFEKLIYNEDLNISCNGLSDGQIAVTAVGGNGDSFLPGSYRFSVDGSAYQPGNIFSALSAGTHTVQVRDERGCVFTDNVFLKEPPKLNISLAAKNYIKCFSDSTGHIEVSASGGLPAYQFKLNNGSYGDPFRFERLPGGDYSITVRDRNGCTAVLNETINSPNERLVIDFSKTNVSCYDAGNGKIEATISGGAGGPLYSWTGRPETGNTIENLLPGIYKLTVTDAEGCVTQKSDTISQPLAPLSASLKTTHIRCFSETNGVLEVINTAGGTSPYSFSINGISFQSFPVFSDNVKGNYTITVRDARGCSLSLNSTIIEPSVLVPAIHSKQDILCFGDSTGTIVAEAVGGVEPYSYSLDGSGFDTGKTFAELVSGNYTVHVKDSFGCVRTVDQTLVQPGAPLSIVYNVTPVQCKGDLNGEIETTLAGGTAPYSYTWASLPQLEDDIDELAAGSYHLTVTDDHGCTLKQDFLVPEPRVALAGTVMDQVNVSCNTYGDGSFRIEPSGGYAPYVYSFNGSLYNETNAYNNLVAATYSVVVRDTMGCVVHVPTIITQPQPLMADFANIDHVSCYGFSDGSFETVVTGGTAPYQYSIDDSLNFQSAPVFSGLIQNDYQVLVVDEQGCTTRENISIVQPLLLTAALQNVVNSSCGQQDGSARVVAVGGTKPFSFSWKREEEEVSTADEPKLYAGLYNIAVTDAQGCIAATQQIIVDEDGPSTSISAITEAKCFYSNDGSATVVATGGAGGYTYLWSDPAAQTTASASELKRGEYLVTVTDLRGCKSLSLAVVNSPEEIDINVVQKILPLCYESCDGQLEVNASGGVTPYTYQWLNPALPGGAIAQNLCRGDYEIRVIDNAGCEGSFIIPLEVPQPLALTVNSIKFTTCAGGNDGTASVSASGGTSPYQYSWNDLNLQTTPEATNLTEGTFSVTATDSHGCITTQEVVLDKIEPIVIDLGGSTMLCLDQSITLNAGVLDAVYDWRKDGAPFSSEKAVTLTQAGVYSLEVTDTKGCKGNDTFTVSTSTRAFKANFLGASELITGDSLELAEVCFPKPDSVHWSFAPGYKLLVDSPDQPQVTYNDPGAYAIVMTGYYAECTDVAAKSVTFFSPEERSKISGRQSLGEAGIRSIKAYPNPTSGQVVVEIEMNQPQLVAMLLYSFQGKELFRVIDDDKLSYRFTFDLSDHMNGVYLARVITNGQKKDLRIVLMK